MNLLRADQIKATSVERKKLIFVDNSYNVYVGGVGVGLQETAVFVSDIILLV